MHLTGIPLETLLRVGAIAGIAVVALYVLKLRRRPVPVPFSPIWTRILGDKEATSLCSQLKRLLSLLVQLALLALLLLALGDPRLAANLVDGRNVVVLIDASASMKATDVKPTRIAASKERVRALLRGLSGRDRLLIARMDATVTPLSTLTGDVAELEAALAPIEASDSAADFPQGLRFAVDTLRGLPSPEVIVASDGALSGAVDGAGPVVLGDVKLSFLPVGTSARNAAISAFSVRRYPLDKSRYEGMLEVTNTSDEPLDLELTLLGDGEVTDVSRLRVGPHERLPRFYPNLSGASRSLEATIALLDGARDDLPADDHAYALLPDRRRARIQVVSRGNMYLDAALLLDEFLEVTTVTPDRYPAAGTFDVTIFDGVTPPVAAGSGGLFYLNPTGENVPFQVGKELVDSDASERLGFDELDTKSPLLRYISLGDVNVARAHALSGDKADAVVGRSYHGALLLRGKRAGVKFVALGFDVRDSDFPLRIAWPLFVLNVINDFVEEDTSYISSFKTGSVWQIPVPSSLESATVVLPSGDRRTVSVKAGRAVLLGQQAGFYRLLATDGGTEPVATFAANLADVAESTIAPSPKLEVAGKVAGDVEGFAMGVRRELWTYLLAAVLCVTAIEWLTYHRRLTV